MSQSKIASAVYILLLLWLSLYGFIYDKISRGLAAPTEDGIFYCGELLSSGGDVNVVLTTFIVFLLPAVMRCMAIKVDSRVSMFEVIAFWASVGVMMLLLHLAELDCGSVFYTAFMASDWALLSVLTSIVIAATILVGLRATQKDEVTG